MATRKSTPPPRRPAAAAPASRWRPLLLALYGSTLRGPPARAAEQALADLLATLDPTTHAQLQGWDGSARSAAGGPEPPRLRAVVLLLLHRVFRHDPFNLPAAQLDGLAAALARLDTTALRALLGPALRHAIAKPRDGDLPVLNAWLTQYLKETSMATATSPTFSIDTSSIPLLQTGTAAADLIATVRSELQNRFGVPAASADPATVATAAAVLGMVVLDGEVDFKSSGLPDAMRRAWLESIGDIDAVGTTAKVPLSTVYPYIATRLATLTNSNDISVQALAYVARQVIAGAGSIPFGHPNFDSAIRIALDQYVQSRAAGDSLTLPTASLPGGTVNSGGDSDLNADTIRVTGLSYALALQERTLVFKVTDRVTELFMNGLLPFGHDAAGKALDDYYWDAEDRLTESQRRSHYSRLLGMPGGEVSKEVSPNKNFEQLFLRFISSVSEFTRQREVDRMFTTRTPQLSMTGEQVRKNAFEVAKNASLYGWGGGFFIATRVNRHLQRSIDILNQPQVLKAYAASNHWQVIERVAQQDFGGAPNWAKYASMAQAANTLFTILAENTEVLAATNSSEPFLFDPNFSTTPTPTTGGLRPAFRGGLDATTTQNLLLAVQQWLAVNGVREDQVQQYAQPVELNTTPSLPGGASMRPEGGMEVVNQLKQLVSGGTPSPEQVQQLLARL